MPTYPLYTAVLAKIGARPVFYRLDPSRGWQPDIEHLRSLVNPKTRALVVIDPNNLTGATYDAETDKALLEIADQHNIPLLADEVRGPGVRRPRQRARESLPRCTGNHVLLAVEGLPCAWLARGLAGCRP